MVRLGLVLAAGWLALAMPAVADTFVSAYAPQPGERSELIIDKCRSDDDGERCARSIYLEEFLEDAPSGADRVRYVTQSIEVLGREMTPAERAAMQEMARMMTFTFHVDESGAPIGIEDREGLMEVLFAIVGADVSDPVALARTRAMFEQMDDATLAQMLGRDFATMSLFQAIELDVGEPYMQPMSFRFPLDASITVEGSATWLVESIDRQAGVARAVYRQALDPESVSAGVRQFIETLVATQAVEPAQRAALQGMRVERTDESRAEIDVASGRVVRIETLTRSGVTTDEENRLRVERTTLQRRRLGVGQ